MSSGCVGSPTILPTVAMLSTPAHTHCHLVNSAELVHVAAVARHLVNWWDLKPSGTLNFKTKYPRPVTPLERTDVRRCCGDCGCVGSADDGGMWTSAAAVETMVSPKLLIQHNRPATQSDRNWVWHPAVNWTLPCWLLLHVILLAASSILLCWTVGSRKRVKQVTARAYWRTKTPLIMLFTVKLQYKILRCPSIDQQHVTTLIKLSTKR